MRSSLAGFALALGLLLPTPAVAAWPPNGLPMPDEYLDEQWPLSCVPDGSGGAVLAWGRPIVFASRVTSDGEFAAGWPTFGVQVQQPTRWAFNPFAVADGAGGAYVVFDAMNCAAHCGPDPTELLAQHVTASGVTADGWGSSGIPVGSGFGPIRRYTIRNTAAVPDHQGGLIVAWNHQVDGDRNRHELRAQRILPSAELVWGSGGVIARSVGPYALSPALAADEAGGAVLVWQDVRAPGLLAQRITAAGAASWAADGVPVVGAAYEDLSQPVVVSDGAGGVIAVWTGKSAGRSGLYAARLDRSGTRRWESAVRLLGAGTSAGLLRAVATPAGGALLAWREKGADGRLSLHVQSIGVRGQLTASSREPLVGPTDGALESVAFATDGHGGAFLCWSEVRPEGHVFALRVGPNGKRAHAWPDQGAVVCGPVATVTSVSLAPDGAGNAIVGWTDVRRLLGTEFWLNTALAMKLGRDGVAVAPASAMPMLTSAPPGESKLVVSSQPGAEFALRPIQPNPGPRAGLVRFSLPTGEPAELALFDVGGRRLWSRDVGELGPGEHSARLADGAWLPPGTYLVRLVQGVRTAATRVTILR